MSVPIVLPHADDGDRGLQPSQPRISRTTTRTVVPHLQHLDGAHGVKEVQLGRFPNVACQERVEVTV